MYIYLKQILSFFYILNHTEILSIVQYSFVFKNLVIYLKKIVLKYMTFNF